MLQDLFDHESHVVSLLKQNPAHQNWKHESDLHQVYLYHLQHERLIHLLVTLMVALFTMIICVVLLFLPTLLLGSLELILILLLLAYLLHYRKLENTVQRWYLLSTQLESKINGV